MAQAKKSKTVKAKPAKTARKAVRKTPAAITTGTQPRSGTKQAQMIELLSRDTGATIADLVAATEWLPHTIRGAMAGALKMKLGLTITSEKVEGRGRVYRLPA